MLPIPSAINELSEMDRVDYGDPSVFLRLRDTTPRPSMAVLAGDKKKKNKMAI